MAALAARRCPSGASTGAHEAVEKRDGDKSRYLGKGVTQASRQVAVRIAQASWEWTRRTSRRSTQSSIELDGTENKSGSAPTPSSASASPLPRPPPMPAGLPLYRYVGGVARSSCPVPMMNIINRRRACRQAPSTSRNSWSCRSAPESLTEAVRCGAEIFHTLKKGLSEAGLSTAVGDEGGFAPALGRTRDALDFIMKSVERAGYAPGDDVVLALDCAATEYYRDGAYRMEGEERSFSSPEMVDYLAELARDYPIRSIEDGMAEDDWDGWKLLTERLGGQVQLVGDDLFVTNPKRLGQGIEQGVGNSILIKVNQIGTLSETLEAVSMAQRASYTAVMSHRSGETEDTTIADLAVATNCGQIKTGSLARSDRLAKYNQLIRIEEELDSAAKYAGRSAFAPKRA
jgi:enolase